MTLEQTVLDPGYGEMVSSAMSPTDGSPVTHQIFAIDMHVAQMYHLERFPTLADPFSLLPLVILLRRRLYPEWMSVGERDRVRNDLLQGTQSEDSAAEVLGGVRSERDGSQVVCEDGSLSSHSSGADVGVLDLE